jgi:signal-transduction protein with cAMP-binding, CBS, and nucleotidyltransferase domain
VIVEEGAPADALLLVIGGYVKVSVPGGASDLALTYLRKGDHAGESALLLEDTWPVTLQALEHVEIVKLSREIFRAVTAAYPDVEDALWDETVVRLKARGALKRQPNSSEYVQMAMETGLIHGESVLLIDLSTARAATSACAAARTPTAGSRASCAKAPNTSAGSCPPPATSARIPSA